MPVYEFRCQNCQSRVGIQLSYAEYGVKKVACPNCGSDKLNRLIGRVRIAKSEDRRMDDMSDPSFLGDVDENDRDQRQGPELQVVPGPKDVEVVEREQHADDGYRDADDELRRDPKSLTGVHRATPLSHVHAFLSRPC